MNNLNISFVRKSIIVTLVLSSLLITACESIGIASQPTPTRVPQVADNFTSVVSATGEVVPAQQSILSFSTSGVIEEVLIEEGQYVEADQPLLRLKGKEELQAAIKQAEYELSASQKALDDLYENSDTQKIGKLNEIAELSQELRDAQYQLDNFTIPSNQDDLETFEGLDLMNEALASARDAYEPYKNRPTSDQTRQDLKEDLDDAQADFDSAVKRLRYEFAVEVAEANLAEARDDYSILLDGPDPDEVAVLEARLENAKASLNSAQASLDDLELLAPFPGTIVDLYVEDGEWVSIGQRITSLADLNDLHVETTDLTEIDMAEIKVGDAALVTFDALPGLEVNGIVRFIALKASEGSGVNYTVNIKMEEIPESLRWGMTAFVDIRVGEE